jgi:thiol-disulfide isomerase/thioredoxin
MGLCLALVGCNTLGRRRAAPDAKGPAVADTSVTLPERTPAGGSAAPTSPAEASGILAGQIIDPTNRPPPPAIIQVSETSAIPAGPPHEVETSSQGYFLIKGLQPGRTYQLTVKSRSGDRVLAANNYATPPDARVVIPVSDNGPASVPSGPAAPPSVAPVQPSGPPAPEPPPSGNGASTSPGGAVWLPGGSQGQGPAGGASDQAPAAELGRPQHVPPSSDNLRMPAPSSGPAVPAPAVSEVRPQDIIKMRGPRDVLPPTTDAQLPPAHGQDTVRVPSCELIGNRLYNLALPDMSGRTWEFAKHRTKLTLIDFWGTWCGHCVSAIPLLKAFQYTYGPYGFEVVGIAYEEGSAAEQVRKIQGVGQWRGMNYTVLLGGDPESSACPVKKQFQVRAFPTVFLLDQQGTILYQAEGLDQQHARTLENIIRQRLGFRDR